ncbi:hypothetical protein P691DRAFT_810223 [Macrolepiota fuliginosa MF-IS2]|uniref:MYND-type domain-containing protein n=1 Tax=Macrolepiota fuliginosa MF-IS2 TaxID=1400762 RepID=A0A9P5X3H3_9AGAR|nr:hypothetical protein P691DRAFT_810223 [Macrolepiota fuliginosa MF-IS2]
MPISRLDFKDKKLFPPFIRLPYDNDYNVEFYEANRAGILQPRRHWCFLAEVTECISWIRPAYFAKDVNGDKIFIAFHTDDRSPEILRECQVGDTFAIMYANSHAFMDGKVGIRVEHDDSVKLFHCDLKAALEIGDILNTEYPFCRACDKTASSKCAKCTVKYCTKECQVADWKPRHKRECVVGQCIMKWKSFDWWRFDYFRTP